MASQCGVTYIRYSAKRKGVREGFPPFFLLITPTGWKQMEKKFFKEHIRFKRGAG